MFSHFIRKKCQLCSQLSSRLKRFARLFFGGHIDCQGINQRTQNDHRVSEINAAAPDCACEKYRMGVDSPGVIGDSEMLARFVFSPYQVDKNGRLKSSAFSHVHDKGCSIQRDTMIENDEVLAFVKRFLESREDHAWKGLLLAECSTVRKILINNSSRRAVCVYDTAEKDNPAHGEICQTHHVIDEDDRVELRHELLAAFGNAVIVQPAQYRSGQVLNELPLSFQVRK